MTSRQLSVGLVLSNGLVFLMALCFTPLSTALGVPWVGYTWEDSHAFIVPHLALSGLLLVFYGFGIAGRVSDSQVGLVSGWAQPLAAGTYLWAMLRWPGGDDGGGMSWLLIVGPVTAAVLLIAAVGAVDRAVADKKSTDIARATFCLAVSVGFGIWIAIPWLDIFVHTWRR